jgi:hypothetical protein
MRMSQCVTVRSDAVVYNGFAWISGHLSCGLIMERVTTVLLFADCADTYVVYIVLMSLLIIAQLFLLRAVDTFKRSSRRCSTIESVRR